MKRGTKKAALFFLALCSALMIPVRGGAAPKGRYTYRIQGETLTISGKGAVPDNASFGNRKQNGKKIKKIVVKKGITSLPPEVFQGYQNLKEIKIASSVKKIGQAAFDNRCRLEKAVMPGNFSVILYKEDGDMMEENLTWGTYGLRVRDVYFNTPLKLKNVSLIDAKNLYVSKKEKKYRTIGGAIYSRDAKELVRVPSARKSYTIRQGCEVFNLNAVCYCALDMDTDAYEKCAVKKIVLPSSIKRVEDDKYVTWGCHDPGVKEIVINTKQLDKESVIKLWYQFNKLDYASLCRQLPEKIKESAGLYVWEEDKTLLYYGGQEAVVTVPEGIREIAHHAFSANPKKNQIQTVIFPASLKIIGRGAFQWMEKLTGADLPEGLEELGEGAFYETGIKKASLPATLKKIGKAPFEYSALEEYELPENMTKIPDDLFHNCYNLKNIVIPPQVTEIGKDAFCDTDWRSLLIPAHVKKVGAGAFSTIFGFYPEEESEKPKRQVVVEGSSRDISPAAFDQANTFITYQLSPAENQTYFAFRSYYEISKTKRRVGFEWRSKVEGADGYEIQFCTSRKFDKKVTAMRVGKCTKGKEAVVLGKGKNVYGRIRPYTMKDGKRVYGRWFVNEWGKRI